jgi:dihydrofolate synthase/folylpolyglutamate synthase
VLQQFLDNKPLYYDEIDYTRMPRAYDTIKKKLTLPKIIHLVGTNGKGTTGRFLASALFASGLRVGHYTSPHILEFNERIWLDATLVDDTTLEEAHTQLLTLLSQEMAHALSYFEYTTLLAMVIFQKCDYVVLEAGLGGEYDATAVFENILTLITPIDKDHEAFLGNTIQEIATTKCKAIQHHAIVAQQPHQEVYEVLQTLCKHATISYQKVETLLDKKAKTLTQKLAKELNLPNYLQRNLQHAIATLNYLGISYTQESFQNGQLFGRLTPFRKNILLDVGHNTLAAHAIAHALQGKKYRVIYNSYKDKEYADILSILKPIIERVEYLEVQENRIETKQKLLATLKQLNIPTTEYRGIDNNKEYLVFGSFSVVETFLRSYHG